MGEIARRFVWRTHEKAQPGLRLKYQKSLAQLFFCNLSLRPWAFTTYTKTNHLISLTHFSLKTKYYLHPLWCCSCTNVNKNLDQWNQDRCCQSRARSRELYWKLRWLTDARQHAPAAVLTDSTMHLLSVTSKCKQLSARPDCCALFTGKKGISNLQFHSF